VGDGAVRAMHGHSRKVTRGGLRLCPTGKVYVFESKAVNQIGAVFKLKGKTTDISWIAEWQCTV